jgi:hypothetical protein
MFILLCLRKTRPTRRCVRRSRRIGSLVACQRCIELPSGLVAASGAGDPRRLAQAVGIVDPSLEADQNLRVVEFDPGFFQFTFVRLKPGIEGGILLDLLDEIGIDPGVVVERFVALLENLGAQRFVG